eukprot:1172681-Karenia_brevis.AAC.1
MLLPRHALERAARLAVAFINSHVTSFLEKTIHCMFLCTAWRSRRALERAARLAVAPTNTSGT